MWPSVLHFPPLRVLLKCTACLSQSSPIPTTANSKSFSSKRLQTICYLQKLVAYSLHIYFSMFGGNYVDRKQVQHDTFWTRKSPLNFLYKYI